MKLLQELCTVAAIPGREQAVIDIMTRELKKTTDQVTVDKMGNVIGVKKSGKKNAKKVMIAGHMDEIGFIVSHIDKKGFIYFSPRGGHTPRVLISQRVRIITGNGNEICGVVEGAPSMLSNDKAAGQKSPELKELFIDTGISAKTIKDQVQIGDFIVMDRPFVKQGDCVITKALDNRVGCYIVLEAMKKIKKHAVDIYAVGTTQEEVGIRGATGVAKDVQPDMGIALDITVAADVPGVKEPQRITELGAGVAIKINDSASISNHGVVEFFKSTAEKHKIKYQMEILPFGGTDARGMQMFGEGPVCTLSIPTRYGHSPNEMANTKDITAAINLLVKFLESCEKCEPKF